MARFPAWNALLHVAPGKGRSSLRDPQAFLNPRTWEDPEAELECLLEALGGMDAPRILNRFPARSEWVADQLKSFSDLPRLPETSEAATWLALANPRRVNLVFADALTKSPPSMFGHLCLVLRNDELPAPLHTCIQFAARMETPPGFMLYYKGLTGGLTGEFQWMHYERKLRDYGSLERRDLWEYELDFTPEEMRRLLLHLWEAQDWKLPYRFLDQNCARMLLEMLRAARPAIGMPRMSGIWVSPLEVLHALKSAGLVATVHWRPSLTHRFALQADALDPSERAVARRLAIDGQAPPEALDGLPPTRWAPVLDLAVLWRESLKKAANQAEETITLRLLTARSTCESPTPTPPGASPPDPSQAHAPARLSLWRGRDGRSSWTDLRWRVALHDLVDPPQGFLPGAEFRAFELVLRRREGKAGVQLDPGMLMGIHSLLPVSPVAHPLSWSMEASLRPEASGPLGEWRRHEKLRLGTGWASARWGCLAYALGLLELQTFRSGSGHSEAGGMELGLLLTQSRTFGLQVKGTWLRRVSGWKGVDREFLCQGRLAMDPSLSVAFEAAWRDSFDHRETTVGIGLHRYF